MWLYRLIKEPRRLWKRYARYNSLFVWGVLRREILTGRLWRERGRTGAGRL